MKPNAFNNGQDMLFVVLACVFVIVIFALGILFLLTLHRVMNKCHRRNREMEPGLVWLNLIPLFNLVWSFITVVRVGKTLKREFKSRGEFSDDDYGKKLGVIALVYNIVRYFIGISLNVGAAIANDPDAMIGATVIDMLLILVSFVLFIIYWMRISGYSQQLNELGPSQRRHSDDEYEDDHDEDDHDDDDLDDRDRRRWNRRDRD